MVVFVSISHWQLAGVKSYSLLHISLALQVLGVETLSKEKGKH